MRPLPDLGLVRGALKTGAPETYPRKTEEGRPPAPLRRWPSSLTRGDAVALVRRPPKGLLGGMLGLPTSDWRSTPYADEEARAAAPPPAPWRDLGAVEHVFTHFLLTLRVLAAEASRGLGSRGGLDLARGPVGAAQRVPEGRHG